MIRIVSKTIAKISYLVIFIISLFLIIYFLLLHGISIDSLKLPQVNIKKLYIKLDKKLIVKADYIKIRKNYNKTDTKSQLLSIKQYLKYFQQIFNEIDINTIEYNNQKLSLKYSDKKFLIDTNDIYLKTGISFQNRYTISLNIQKLILKQIPSTLRGVVGFNLNQNKAWFDGDFNLYKLKGQLKLTLKNDMLTYYIYNTNGNTLKHFMDFVNTKITLDKEISNWIYGYIIAKKYRLKYLYGRFNFKTDEFYPSTIRAEAVANEAKVKFNKNLPAVHIDKVEVTLKNNILNFKLFQPVYKGISLSGSNVVITKLLSKGTNIKVNILATHRFDKTIKNILKAYNVNIPMEQITSETKSKVSILIHFVPYKFDIKGDFTTTNSDFRFKNVNFYTKNAHILLENNKIFLKNSNISYKDLFDINSSGVFDTHSNMYKGDLIIQRLYLIYKDTMLLDGKNSTRMPVVVDFKDGKITLSKLSANIILNKKYNIFKLDSLKNIYSLSPLLQKYGIKNGKIDINTKDFETFSLDGNTTLSTQNILQYKGKPIQKFAISAKIKKELISIELNNGLIKAEIGDEIKIKTKDISYNLKDIVNDKTDKIKAFSKPLTIEAKNSSIYLTSKLTIPTEDFTLFINGDKKIFSGTFKNNHIFYSKDRSIVDMHTNYLSAKYFDKILGHNIFQDGFFKLTIKEKESIFRGECSIINTTIKSLKKNGSDYHIKNGKFSFILKDHMLTLNNIVLKNSFSTLKGNGVIDMNLEKLYLKFKVTILKNLGKNIKSIPLLGYIFLGKDGKFTSHVTISGNFDNPKIETDFAKDVIQSPFNIIFRTIKLPFKLFLPSSNP